MKTAIEFKKIYEHDIDLLIIEEFLSDKGFARLFLDKVGLDDNYTIIRAAHSLSDFDGESDITLILEYPDKKIALLIEDKIDAPTMPEQSTRYCTRGSNAKQRGEYNDYHVILVAPEEYHEEHTDDPNAAYNHRVLYEELLDYFMCQDTPRAAVKASLISFAISEKKAGYQVQEVEAVTRFWNDLRNFCKANFPKLDMVGKEAPKGASACWPEFRTTLGTIKVIYKAQKGYVDLELPMYGNRIANLMTVVGCRLTNRMQVTPTGKSASIRIRNDSWKLDFTRNFQDCSSSVYEILEAVSELCDLASHFNYSDLY